jgi:exoribonuclease-2
MKDPSAVSDLRAIARKAMTDRGLEPDFPPDAIQQLRGIPGPARDTGDGIRDLRSLLWCSIDNDSSLDLDQLTVAQQMPAGGVKVLVAIADVDALVKAGSPIDRHAGTNTTSVYTAAQIFPMLPERLSTDLTSLGEGQDRLAIVVEMVVTRDGSVQESAVYRALVTNHAKLAYRSVAAWLDGTGPAPPRLAGVAGMEEQLRMQDQVAQAMRAERFKRGALDFETLEPEAIMEGDRVVDLRLEAKNRAKELIEDFMIASNGVSARFLEQHGLPTLQRIVRSPEQWDRIRAVAAGYSDSLPATPDSQALGAFLTRRRQADPLRFPDLSLTIVKLMGPGEYVVQAPCGEPTGHFGLAVREYSQSTAPNRRYPDLITQRLLKAAIAGNPQPYATPEMLALATHCTDQEDAAKKVERHVRKSAAAQFLTDRIGESFDAIVTGASEKGTWVRVPKPPVEGKLMVKHGKVAVGDQIRVRLTGLNVERGFIDFAPTGT